MCKKPLAAALAIACAASFAGLPAAFAQGVPGEAAAASVYRRSAAELETLVGPIALYPDDLVAIVLPSATTPLEIVKAQRFLDKRKTDSSLQPDPNLPESVRNLLNYPDVIKKMSDDLDWTEGLGQAVVDQQGDVMDAIQAFRRRVHAAGNLKTDEKQVVVVEKEVIKVIQADPQVIYVPQYQPAAVVVAQPYPYAYYPTPYPVYYYPYAPGVTFATGFFFGAATAYALGWGHHQIHHHYDVEDLQEERMDYARESREDWQSHRKEMQSQRSENVADRRSQRQEAAGARQGQRQEAAGERQGQRQQGVSDRQAQRPQADGGQLRDRSAATTGQRAASRENWRPQAQATQRGGAQQPAASRGARAGDYQSAGNRSSSAFGGMGSGADASRSSMRGNQSRYGGGPAAGSGFSGGSRSSFSGGSRGGFSGGARGGGGRGGRR